MNSLVVGVDWATDVHAACALGADGNVLSERKVEHSADGIHSFIEWLIEKNGGKTEGVRVGIESPSLVLVEILLERGFEVYAINPKQSDRFRDRRSTSGAKDDRRDAEVIATALLKDPDCFHRVPPLDAERIAIREASRAHDDLMKSRVGECAKLREVLARFVPDFLRLAKEVERDWVLSICESICEVGPKKVTRRRVKSVLKQHRVRRVSEEETLVALRAELGLHPASEDALRKRSRGLIERIRLLNKQIAEQKSELAELLRRGDGGEQGGLSHADILLSFPGVGPLVAATLFAEAPQAVAEGSYSALRLYAGVAPVTISSGKSRRVTQRRACNGRLATAMFHWAKCAIRVDPTCKVYAERLKARGQSFGRRLRAVADKLLRALSQALKHRERFDPQRFAGRSSTPKEKPVDSEGSSARIDNPRSVDSDRLSGDTLRRLRNEVPVGALLEAIRPGSSKPGRRKLRCPNCGQERARAYEGTNLLNCFACERRWNPIDLLMEVTTCDFRTATAFLFRLLETSCGSPAPAPASVPPGGGTAPEKSMRVPEIGLADR